MKYIIEESDRTPVYIQLYRFVRNDIVSGVYPYNSKLPSKRTVAEEMGISTITVEHAYALLCDEGYVESKERSGFFVIFRTDDGFAVSFDKRTLSFESLFLSCVLFPPGAAHISSTVQSGSISIHSAGAIAPGS